MAKLIMTEEEKTMNIVKFSDDALGKMVRALALDKVKFVNEEPDDSIKKSLNTAACMSLIFSEIVEMNAEEFKSKLYNLTSGDKKIGNYEIIIRKFEE